MGRAPCAKHARPLLRQRTRVVLLRPGTPETGAVDVGVHAQSALCRPGAATRLAQAADLAAGARPVCQRHALRGRLGAAALGQRAAARAMVAVRAAPRGAACHGGGGAGAPARRHGPGGTGGQDHRHDHRQRRAAGRLQGQGRAPGHRRGADGAGPRRRSVAVRRHDPGRHGAPRRRAARRRLPRDPRRRGHAAAPALPERLQAREPLRVRHPSAVAGVLQEGQAGRDPVARVAAAADGFAGEGDGLRAALRLFARRGHPLAHRRRGRGLADRGRRHAAGDHEPQPRVHLSPLARGRGHGAQAGGADHGAGRVHQGRRRCRRDRGAPGAAAHHHRQQLQRQRRAVGGARRAAAHAAAAAAARQGTGEVQGHGRRCHRRHRLGLRAAAGARRRGGLPGIARDRQAAGAEGRDRAGKPWRESGPRRQHRPRSAADGHGRHRHLGRGQEGAGHHEGQAGLRHHRRGAPARPAARRRWPSAPTCW